MKKSIFLFFAAILCSVSSWAANVGFESSGNTMKYYSNLKSSDQTVNLDRTNGTTTTLGSVTALYLKGFACKMYQDADNTIWGGGAQHAYYKIHRTAVAAGTSGYTDVTNWDWNWQNWNNSWRYPTGSKSLDVNLLSGLGSGKYSMTYYFQQKGSSTWRLPSTSSKYNVLTWTVNVPDITSAECTSNGTGLGTETSPFMVPEGDILTLTIKGTQKSNDANSELYAQFASNAYSSTLTHNITPTTTVQSITIKVKYYNSADELSSNEKTLTIYYKAIQEETHNVTISCQCNGNKIENIDDEMVKVGVSTPSEITAPAIAGYTFDSWEPRDGITQKSVAGNAITIITKTGFNESDYTLVANYNEDLTSGWTLKGSFVDDFATAYDFTKKSGESTGKVAYVSIDLETDKEYQFKVVEGETWYGNNNSDEQWWIKQTVENWDFYHDAGNCHMKTGLAGTYTFKIDYSGSNPKVSVIYPIVYTITATAANGTVEGAGTYVEGTTVYLTAIPAEGYHFVKWSNESTTNPLTITVTEDIELQAIFDINTYTVTTTAENGKVTGAGEYTHGTEVTLTATPNFDYEFVKWSNGETENPLTITVTEDVTLEAIFEEVTATDQTLSGKFSTGEYEYAEFATGNLQYNTGTDKWRFAKQQYQVVGEDNINVGDPNYKGWIDMLGWSTNDPGNNFGVNPSMATAFYTGNFNDWGIKIGEGWLTLTHNQWYYLLNERANASSLKQVAYVGTVFGIMLFPDNWIYPDGCEVEKTLNHDDADGDVYDFYSYNYTLAQWTKLEAAGAVFLPAAGRRFGGHGNTYNSNGEDTGSTIQVQHSTNGLACYWTSSKHTDGKRVSSLFNLLSIGGDKYKYGILNLGWYGYGNIGQSVRLAKVTSTAYTRNVTNKYGTICLPYASASTSGAYFYKVAGKETGKVYLESVDALEAGVPYIFEATAGTITVTYQGEAVDAPVNTNANGLVGTFVETTVPDGDYILYNNAFCTNEDAGTLNKIKENRAYLDMDAVTGGVPQQMPGRRYIGMSVQGENEATGFENITNGENITIKTIENGQLIIIRNGEKFNAQGVRF